MRKRLSYLTRRRAALVAALFFLALKVGAQPRTIRGGNGITSPSPPVADVRPVTDDYNGTKITDNYRWLEDAKSPETRAWIDAENKYTQDYLSQVVPSRST